MGACHWGESRAILFNPLECYLLLLRGSQLLLVPVCTSTRLDQWFELSYQREGGQ